MRAWIGVASAEHVAIGQAGGFMQLCHGKAAPVRRIAPGDAIAYYSPSRRMGDRDGLQSFTAFGVVAEGAPYTVEMAPGFTPWRRNVLWHATRPAPMRPLVDRLELTRGRANWGSVFRFGVVEITRADAALIATAMGTDLPEDRWLFALAD